ncbi:hypothetical protein KC842_01735 [Candidatus Nomurabacteria bacterium]|nr:hypothetical protein [Candidatus Nomurabacteria bacterium]USN95050.1 MAG: hypothetical protein H6791_01305 [Candidatus Nomurabacteria bacterium]
METMLRLLTLACLLGSVFIIFITFHFFVKRRRLILKKKSLRKKILILRENVKRYECVLSPLEDGNFITKVKTPYFEQLISRLNYYSRLNLTSKEEDFFLKHVGEVLNKRIDNLEIFVIGDTSKGEKLLRQVEGKILLSRL